MARSKITRMSGDSWSLYERDGGFTFPLAAVAALRMVSAYVDWETVGRKTFRDPGNLWRIKGLVSTSEPYRHLRLCHTPRCDALAMHHRRRLECLDRICRREARGSGGLAREPDAARTP